MTNLVSPTTFARRKAAHERLWDPTAMYVPSNARETIMNNMNASNLARKYGHQLGNWGIPDHRLLRSTGKSGLTPLPLLPPAKDMMEEAAYDQLRTYQRMRLCGFTTETLFNAEALPAYDTTLMSSTLDNGIHKIFQRKWWFASNELPTHKANPPIMGDSELLWDADEPAIWNIILPSLQLATAALASLAAFTWLDAMFNGTVYRDATNTPDDPYRFWRISERDVIERSTPEQYERVQNQLLELVGLVRWQFHSATSYGFGDEPLAVGYVHGCTTPIDSPEPWKSEVSISTQMLQTLLREDLTDAERLVEQYHVAHVVLHELGHAIWQCIWQVREPLSQRNTEPYFGTEQLNELGYSFTDKIWHGDIYPMQTCDYSRGGPGLPAFGYFKADWFSSNQDSVYLYTSTRASTVDPNRNPNNDLYPIPVSWFNSIFQQITWDVVNYKFGSYASMGPFTVGTRIFDGNLFPDWTAFITSNDPDLTQIALSLPPEAASIIPSVLHDRTVQLERITTALRLDPQTRQAINAGQGNVYKINMLRQPLSNGPYDNLGRDELPPIEQYVCPRADEIIQYMLRNRAPLELALDTMTLLPFSIFHSYITARGGIDLTPVELRQFLGLCNQNKVFFLFEAFPTPGMVIRISPGWPAAPYSNWKVQIYDYNLNIKHYTDGKNKLMTMIRSDLFKNRIWWLGFKMMRDMDIRWLGAYLTQLFPVVYFLEGTGAALVGDGLQDGGVRRSILERIEFYVVCCVVEGLADEDFVLGPKGVIRFTYEIESRAIQMPDPNWQRFYKNIDDRVDNANLMWRTRDIRLNANPWDDLYGVA